MVYKPVNMSEERLYVRSIGWPSAQNLYRTETTGEVTSGMMPVIPHASPFVFPSVQNFI